MSTAETPISSEASTEVKGIEFGRLLHGAEIDFSVPGLVVSVDPTTPDYVQQVVSLTERDLYLADPLDH